MTAQTAVVVLNWNGRRWLEQCLSAVLAQQAADFEVWLVDNASADDSVPFVRQRFPSVNILRLDRNYGFGAAYNRAAAATTTQLLALLNNDAVVQDDWLRHLVARLDSDPQIAAVGSKLLYLQQPDVINHAGGRLTTLGAAYDVGLGVADRGQFDTPRTTGCATGAAMLMRRSAFERVGGFDERYFAYFDDADLCWRFWLSGRMVTFEPAARALHAYGGSTGSGRLSAFRIRHCQINRLQNMFKHLETRTLLAALPASFAYDAVRLWQLARMMPTGGAGLRALAGGWKEFAKLLPAVLDERALIQRTRKRSDSDLRQQHALVDLSTARTEWRRLGGLGRPISVAAVES
jgi:GT2 family glycosyltransferase